jgi:hypothetical protein
MTSLRSHISLLVFFSLKPNAGIQAQFPRAAGAIGKSNRRQKDKRETSLHFDHTLQATTSASLLASRSIDTRPRDGPARGCHDIGNGGQAGL